VTDDGEEDSDEDEDYGPDIEDAIDGKEMDVVDELLPIINADDDCEMMISGNINADNNDVFNFASLATNASENDIKVVLKVLNHEFEHRSNMVPLKTNILFEQISHLLSENNFIIILDLLRRNGLINMDSIITNSSDTGPTNYYITKTNMMVLFMLIVLKYMLSM
jgi:hypothetical protein